MSGKTISNSETRIEALKLQSSAYGVTIPWVMGVTRIPGNLVWYGGFKAHPNTTTQGGKGGVKVQSTSYTYTASVIMGLAHGAISGIPRVWRGKKLYSGGLTAGQVKTATETYIPPLGGDMTYTVAHADTWLALVSVTVYGWSDLSDRYESTPLSADTDYQVKNGVLKVLNEGLFGQQINIIYQYSTGIVANDGLTQLGLSFLSGEVGQSVWSGLCCAPEAERLGYSGLACVAGQDYDLGSGAQVENHTLEIIGPGAYALGSTVPDVDPAMATRELLTNARFGAGFPGQQLDAWQAWSDWCVATGLLISPALTEQTQAAQAVSTMAELTNTAPVWSQGRLLMVPYGDSPATGNGRTFTPNTTPVYDLDDDCYIAAPGEPPVQVEIKTPADRFNHVRVEWLNRASQYSVEISEV